MMLSREKASSGESVDPRVRISAWNVHTLPCSVTVAPKDRDSMSCILRPHSNPRRKTPRSYMREPNEANPRQGVLPHKFRPERLRHKQRGHFGINAIVDEEPAFDNATQDWNGHHWRTPNGARWVRVKWRMAMPTTCPPNVPAFSCERQRTDPSAISQMG